MSILRTNLLVKTKRKSPFHGRNIIRVPVFEHWRAIMSEMFVHDLTAHSSSGVARAKRARRGCQSGIFLWWSRRGAGFAEIRALLLPGESGCDACVSKPA